MLKRTLCMGLLLCGLAQEAEAQAQYQYDENEGKNVARFKVGFALKQENQSAFTYRGTAITVTGESEDEYMIDTAASLEAEWQRFVTDHFSIGGSIGFQPQDSKTWCAVTCDTGFLGIVPMAVLVQVHPAPYGEIRPYIGLGYHYSYMINSYDVIDVGNEHGGIAQLGADWWLGRSWGFNLDMKKYWMNVETDWSGLYTSGISVTSDIEYSPTVFSVGLAYRF